MKLTTAQVDAAVAWWIQALRNPKFDALGPTRGTPDIGNGPAAMAEAIAVVVAAENPIPEDTIGRFGTALRRRLEVADPPPHGLFVDYGPDHELREAADEAGVSNSIATFPWKTRMWFEHGGVQVASGYGAKTEEILLNQGGAPS